MSTVAECPSCARKLRVPEDLLGRKVQCPSCGTQFMATSPDSAPAKVPDDAPAPVPEDDDEPRSKERQLSPQGDDEQRPGTRREPVEEEYEDEPRRRRRRSWEKPGKVQAIAIMMLVGGILATITSLSWLVTGLATAGLCCLWPGGYYSLVLGIMAIVRASSLLGKNADLQTPPKGIAIMQIINIVNADVPNCVMGILTLVFINDPEVSDYFRR